MLATIAKITYNRIPLVTCITLKEIIMSDSYKTAQQLNVDGKTYHYYDLKSAEKNGLTGIAQLPCSLKVLLENMLRFEDGNVVTKADIDARFYGCSCCRRLSSNA